MYARPSVIARYDSGDVGDIDDAGDASLVFSFDLTTATKFGIKYLRRTYDKPRAEMLRSIKPCGGDNAVVRMGDLIIPMATDTDKYQG